MTLSCGLGSKMGPLIYMGVGKNASSTCGQIIDEI